jgi:hypothetical protein
MASAWRLWPIETPSPEANFDPDPQNGSHTCSGDLLLIGSRGLDAKLQSCHSTSR